MDLSVNSRNRRAFNYFGEQRCFINLRSLR